MNIPATLLAALEVQFHEHGITAAVLTQESNEDYRVKHYFRDGKWTSAVLAADMPDLIASKH